LPRVKFFRATMILFAVTALLSAFLLFWIEPLFTRLVLPMLGGSPSVWNTCLMFFQTLLLLGYLYAHVTSRFLTVRRQAILHFALLALCIATLPVAIPAGWTPPSNGNVIPWLLLVLTVSLGAPFLILSATAPLVQRWYAALGDGTRNPYPLYAASNAGSFIGLLAFPLVIEPSMGLVGQTRTWMGIYIVAVLLAGLCVRAVIQGAGQARADATVEMSTVTWFQRLKWIALAFVPSSLLLGVTTFLSTDIAATPLLWVIPLSIYLLTFVIVFAQNGNRIRRPASFIHALLISVLAVVVYRELSLGFRLGYALHLALFAFTALVLHGELAGSRPRASKLTEYYLWMAFGGALGGTFAALVVPFVFKSANDYFMMLVIACFLRPTFRSSDTDSIPGFMKAAAIVAPVLLLAAVSKYGLGSHWNSGGITTIKIASAVAVFIALTLEKSAIRFGLAISAMVAAGLFFQHHRETIFRDRSFFGIYRVTNNYGPTHILYHGSTIHGAEFLDSARRLDPITYYHRRGPVGEVFDSLQRNFAGRKVGAVGLGTGSILCYSKPGESWTFFEIDPHVVRISQNPRYFGFLSGCAVRPRIVLGDARLTIGREPANQYSLLILDAFSSDAIPIHLLTREAFAQYRRVLRDDGLLMVHISNRRLNLEPVVGALAADTRMVALIRNHAVLDEIQDSSYEYGSDWVVVAKRAGDLALLARDARWRPVRRGNSSQLWTDDYSNLFSVIKW
jgi:hypothetical protein